MEVTLAEAAEALSVNHQKIGKWYTGRKFNRPKLVIDTEELCDILELDHRFLMAFLSGYDTALSRSVLMTLFRKDYDWISYHSNEFSPVLRLGRIVRYSQRRIAPILSAHLYQGKKKRASNFGGGNLKPPPDQCSADMFQFTSSITTEGMRIPRAVLSKLATGSESKLPRRA